MLFGERLTVRKAKKISQDELAKRIGVHALVSDVMNVER